MRSYHHQQVQPFGKNMVLTPGGPMRSDGQMLAGSPAPSPIKRGGQSLARFPTSSLKHDGQNFARPSGSASRVSSQPVQSPGVSSKQAKYSCFFCNREFPTKLGYTGHMNMHAGAKPFQCQICFKSFQYSNSLSRHKKQCKGLVRN